MIVYNCKAKSLYFEVLHKHEFVNRLCLCPRDKDTYHPLTKYFKIWMPGGDHLYTLETRVGLSMILGAYHN